MRRKFLNKKGLILIILTAIFTIFSYAFDQLAIHEEDTLRTNKIYFEDLKVNNDQYTSLLNQLDSISRRADKIVEHSLKNRNLYSKYYMAYKLKSLKIFKEEVNNILSKEKENQIKSILVDNFITAMRDGFEIADSLNTLYFFNKLIFDNPKNDQIYEKYAYKKIINKNIDQLSYKDPNLYIDIFLKKQWEGEGLENIQDKFNLQNWLDINFLTISLIKNIDNNKYEIWNNIDTLQLKLSENTNEKNKVIKLIEKSSSMKNYFILSSIISQVTSLFFLLILFRHLILNHRL